MIEPWLDRLVAWAAELEDVRTVLLVGSHARGDARPESDIDIVLLCRDPTPYLRDESWVRALGDLVRIEREDWGAVQSVRAFFRDGPEIELGVTSTQWAALPLDPGTAGVLADGGRVLLDRDGSISELLEARIDRDVRAPGDSSLDVEAAGRAVQSARHHRRR